MKRRLLIAGLCAGLLAPTSVWAQAYADQVVQQLREQGYVGISVNQTWLGRTRILARSGDGEREIIVDPRTGEILRDLYSGRSSGPRIVDDRPTGSSGTGSSPNDDDDEADDADEDRSGSGGSGNDSSDSGHGGDSDSDSDSDDEDEEDEPDHD